MKVLIILLSIIMLLVGLPWLHGFLALQSIEKLAPWVWLMQSVVSLWYLTEGRKLPEARAARRRLGKWDTEWSLRHMLGVLRRAILRKTITLNSPTKDDLHQIIDELENYVALAN